jgi:UDP-N-acetylglucosamine 2-epimerase (non-hydrolysing)
MKMRLMTILGTRPDLIKMSRVIPVLDQNFEHIFVHTGQNYDYELHGIFFDQMGIREPDEFLGVENHSLTTPTAVVANIMVKADLLMEKYEPDAILFYGDTNSTLAVYPAKRRKIPIFHMEAGNRSFNALVPEETNRKIIDHLADVNMTNSEHARQYLLREGLPPHLVIKTGSPMKEVLVHHVKDIEHSDVLSRLDLSGHEYFVINMHREANVDTLEQLSKWVQTFNNVVEFHKMPAIFSCHPRTMQKIEKAKALDWLPKGINPLIRVMKPLGFADYCALQKNALCTISDSGTITEEASILNFPAVTIRKAHERPEGMDEGTVTMVGNPEDLMAAIQLKINQFHGMGGVKIVPDYDVPQISQKVANIILSYTDYVDRIVWRKHL